VIALIYAHPHPDRSLAGRALVDAVRALPGVTLRSLYDAYPDFSIDVAAERELLQRSRLVIWQHPLYWYGVPSLLKRWMEAVLESGWAYDEGGTALAGKDCLWVTSTGAAPDAYTPQGKHAHPFSAFVPAVEQTARFCGMNWLAPIVVHGAHRITAADLQAHAAAYRVRLDDYLASQR
jgi:glutathione-regulated potassium-efflux system ancillary protein KefF